MVLERFWLILEAIDSTENIELTEELVRNTRSSGLQVLNEGEVYLYLERVCFSS